MGGPTVPPAPSPALGSRQGMASMEPPPAAISRPITGSWNCCEPVRLAEDVQGIPGCLWLSPCTGRQAQDEESSCVQ